MRDYSATLTKVFDKTRNTHNESPETKHSIKLIETIRTNSETHGRGPGESAESDK